MKVLYLTGMYPTPAYPQKGIFCHEQVKALKNLGIEVTVVVPVVFYDREVKVKEWEYEGITVRYVRFFKLPKALDFHKTGKSLFRSLKRNIHLTEYDLIHADAALPTGQAAMYGFKKYGIPYVVHGHGLDVFLDVSYKDKKNCEKIVDAGEEVFRQANAIIGVSKKVIDNVQARVDISSKSYVAYNGVDTEKFKPVHKQPSDIITVISIGNLIPLKGHRYLLQAIKALKDKGVENIKCQIVGRGYLDEELKAQARELGIEKQVEFKGYVPYAEVATLLKDADIFALPSYYEALGCVYLEAMACGVPAIGCYENGIDEIIEDGKDGALVREKDVLDIVRAIEAFMDEGVRVKVGDAARKKVEEGYTWIHSAKSVEKVYRKVIDGR